MPDNDLLEVNLKYGESFLIGVIGDPSNYIIQSYINDLECSENNIQKFQEYIKEYSKVSWIDEIFVVERQRGKGIGSKLIEKFEKLSKIENSEIIVCEPDLEPPIEFDSLIRFYEKQGFTYNNEFITMEKEV